MERHHAVTATNITHPCSSGSGIWVEATKIQTIVPNTISRKMTAPEKIFSRWRICHPATFHIFLPSWPRLSCPASGMTKTEFHPVFIPHTYSCDFRDYTLRRFHASVCICSGSWTSLGMKIIFLYFWMHNVSRICFYDDKKCHILRCLSHPNPSPGWRAVGSIKQDSSVFLTYHSVHK